MITIEQLILEVRRLAKESPNNKYVADNTDGSSFHSKACFYNRGTCTNGATGCIFGQALKNLGSPVPNQFDLGSGANIGAVLAHVQYNIKHSPLVDWCRNVQKAQDKDEPWSECIVDADLSNYGVDVVIPQLTESVIDGKQSSNP